MSEAKHTPGPWYFDCNHFGTMPHAANIIRSQKDGDNGISDSDGLMVVGVGDCGWEDFGDAPSLSDADAALISAAPELLDSLENLAAAFETMLCHAAMPEADRLQRERLLGSAKDAIAKATGE